MIDRDRFSSNRQPSNSLPSVERLPHFLGSNFGSNQLDFGFQFRLRFLVQVRVRPNCSHNMRDVTAFVSPLSNCPPLQEIIPPRHRLSFPLPSRQNLTFWIFSMLEFHFLMIKSWSKDNKYPIITVWKNQVRNVSRPQYECVFLEKVQTAFGILHCGFFVNMRSFMSQRSKRRKIETFWF